MPLCTFLLHDTSKLCTNPTIRHRNYCQIHRKKHQDGIYELISDIRTLCSTDTAYDTPARFRKYVLKNTKAIASQVNRMLGASGWIDQSRLLTGRSLRVVTSKQMSPDWKLRRRVLQDMYTFHNPTPTLLWSPIFTILAHSLTETPSGGITIGYCVDFIYRVLLSDDMIHRAMTQ